MFTLLQQQLNSIEKEDNSKRNKKIYFWYYNFKEWLSRQKKYKPYVYKITLTKYDSFFIIQLFTGIFIRISTDTSIGHVRISCLDDYEVEIDSYNERDLDCWDDFTNEIKQIIRDYGFS